MKVILLQDVARVGKAGDIKEVKNGYAFNFLLPEGLAEVATPQLVKQAEKFIAKRKQELEAAVIDLKTKASAVSGRSVRVKTKAEENGKLFGSIGKSEIALALESTGVSIDAQAIVLTKPFKEVGSFPVEADFGHGVKASFELTIEAE